MDMSSNGCKNTRRETRDRPRKLNKRHERKLRRSIEILREQEGNFTIRRLVENVSESTISSFLNKRGLLLSTSSEERSVNEG
jgi:hypothetical protein